LFSPLKNFIFSMAFMWEGRTLILWRMVVENDTIVFLVGRQPFFQEWLPFLPRWKSSIFTIWFKIFNFAHLKPHHQACGWTINSIVKQMFFKKNLKIKIVLKFFETWDEIIH
jgi:hypothetical protein